MDTLKSIYEKAGLFYLGKDVDKNSLKPTDTLTLLKNKNFTTHATIIGMTGSGKTGLGISLIEEAAIDNIPAIIIDPKGDMGDLLLTDPSFDANNFLPWVEDDAKAKGEEPLEYAKKVAKTWQEGIESWHQDKERVKKFAQVDKTIYTPGSTAGVSINILSSLERPSSEILEDSDSFSSYLSSTVNSLLSLIGVEGNALESKEFILLSQIIANSWQNGQNLTLDSLITEILNPPFKKIGVLPLDSFISEDERFKLANRFNIVIASPSFMGWLCGESLDIDKLLFDENAKAKISIFSISHLSDEQRMFFVTLLLNKIVAWMRRQSGSSRLKALLYMDEIYGYFPPTKNPPSKEPMITLLKQARAFGLGVVLSTQNPVDLDYKGLSNIGTWFIGRLQTKQDINRVISGLEGKIDSSFSKDEIENLLSNLDKRVFFLKSAHLDDIRLFNTRWVLSYLKGPLKKSEISKLMADKKGQKSVVNSVETKNDEFVSSIILNGNIVQRYEVALSAKKEYAPYLASNIEINYIDTKRSIDEVKEFNLEVDLTTLSSCSWDDAQELEKPLDSFALKAPSGAKYLPLPSFISEDKDLKKCQRELKNFIYNSEKMELYRCKKLRLESKVDEDYSSFEVRLQEVLKDKFENELDKLKDRYDKKIDRLHSQIQRAKLQVEKEKADQTSSLISAGISLIGALFGRKSLLKIATAASRGGRVLKERGDLTHAQEKLQNLEDKLLEIQDELEEKIDELSQKYSLENYPIDTIFIKPKKSSINIKEISILWRSLV